MENSEADEIDLLAEDQDFNSPLFLTEEAAQDRLKNSPLNAVINFYMSAANATN